MIPTLYWFISLITLFAHMVAKSTKPLDLDDEALKAISIGKQGILRATSKDDLLVFLGNSASYFYYSISKERDSDLIPISGRYLIDAWTIPDIEKRKLFEEVYLSPTVTKALREDRRIIIVDHSHTGQSVDSFNLLLNEYCSACRKSFVNLITEDQQIGGIVSPKTIETLGKVVLPNVAVDLFNDKYVRLTPNHPHWKWDESSPTLLKKYGENSPRVLEAISRIESSSSLRERNGKNSRFLAASSRTRNIYQKSFQNKRPLIPKVSRLFLL